MAVEANSDVMIIVSCDLVWTVSKLINKARKKLKKILPNFPLEKLVVGVTHTHTSLMLQEDTEFFQDMLNLNIR